MDTLFRIFSLQPDHQSYNSSRTTTSTTSKPNPSFEAEEGCYNVFMDEEAFSSYTTATPTTTASATPPPPHAPPPALDFTGSWADNLLLEAARAIADNDSARVQQLMWMLNELSSPYGDLEQKLAHYFLTALFNRMTGSGER